MYICVLTANYLQKAERTANNNNHNYNNVKTLHQLQPLSEAYSIPTLINNINASHHLHRMALAANNQPICCSA